jgi:hypothetical protein
VGYSENPKSFDAGAEMAKQAMAGAGIENAILRSCIQRQSRNRFNSSSWRSFCYRTSKARLIGGYSMGIITNDYLGYEGYQAGYCSYVIRFN